MKNIFLYSIGCQASRVTWKPGNFRFISARQDHSIVDLIEVPSEQVEIFLLIVWLLTINWDNGRCYHFTYPSSHRPRDDDEVRWFSCLSISAVAVPKITHQPGILQRDKCQWRRNLKINLPCQWWRKTRFLFMEQFIESKISAKRQILYNGILMQISRKLYLGPYPIHPGHPTLI